MHRFGKIVSVIKSEVIFLANDKFTELRNKYESFTYEGWSLSKEADCINIEFNFSIDGLCEFHPKTSIKTDNLDILNRFDSETAQKIIFNLGMVELISYWKCACPKKVEVKCGQLSQKDVLWWKKLYFRGLSEFFYINSIETDEESFMEISSLQENAQESEHHHAHECGCHEKYASAGLNLIPVGGGKDSCVTASLLKKYADKNKFFTVNDQQARTDTVLNAGYGEKDIVRSYRTIDKNLLKLNLEGFLNGHTPFSAIVAFLSLYCAYLIGADFIVLSNESSANESNIEGAEVNHQYSKSYEFECDFEKYVQRNIFGAISYFSLLRPFSELQIAKMFASLPEYHNSFRSCNKGSKQNIWCGKCAKCLFVFTILSPFTEYEKLVGIFGNDMLDDEDMKSDFDGLAGFTKLKPFECVGTKSEFNFALERLAQRLTAEGKRLPKLVEYFIGNYDKSSIDENLLNEYNPMNNVPDDFLETITEMYKNVAENY